MPTSEVQTSEPLASLLKQAESPEATLTLSFKDQADIAGYWPLQISRIEALPAEQSTDYKLEYTGQISQFNDVVRPPSDDLATPQCILPEQSLSSTAGGMPGRTRHTVLVKVTVCFSLGQSNGNDYCITDSFITVEKIDDTTGGAA